jgi:arylsulfatase A
VIPTVEHVYADRSWCLFRSSGCKGPTGHKGPIPALVIHFALLLRHGFLMKLFIRLSRWGVFVFLFGPIITSCIADDRPNVVLILADDLGWADLGCYGSKFHRTPNLDALAAAGQRFTQAYSACHVCSPTRAALMTGKHPARLQLTDWLPGRPNQPAQKLNRPTFRQHLPLDEVTIAERLRAAGYATGQIGKWHLGGPGFEATKQGFDSSLAGDDRGSPASYIAPFIRGNRPMPGLEAAAVGEYLTDRLALEAENFIEAHQKDPFFLYLPHFAVHTPLVAKPELQATYPKWDNIPHGRQENPIYAAMLESLDQGVGRVVKKLAQLGLTERTLIIFTSDNGGLATLEGANTPATINAPLREGKGWLYEGGVRVPLVVCWPKKIPGGQNETPVWTPDLPVTIASLCQAESLPTGDGTNLSDLLYEGKQLAPREFYWHYPHYSNQGGRPGGAIRDGDWKLVEFYESNRRELFNIADDIRESRNLAEQHPDRVAVLANKLEEWRKSVNAQMPMSNPDYMPNPQDKSGSVILPASTAEVHGVMLRYEPLPHKNTLGFWVRQDDWAHWEFHVQEAGEFRIEVQVGCGNGSGGSDVEFRIGEQSWLLTVPETGGFQQFVTRDLGSLAISRPGRYRLEVRARSKPGPAVMDLREVKLWPIKKSTKTSAPNN